MGKFTSEEIKSKSVWENYVLSCDPKSFLQSWNWGESNRITGKKIFRIGFFEARKLIGVCLIIKENAKRGSHFIIPGGPLIDWGDKKLVNYFLEVIKYYARRESVWFVRVRPELFDNQKNRGILQGLGFISAPMHLHAENTWILDIDKDEDTLLREMRKSTRYLIKKSVSAGLDLSMTFESDKAEVLSALQEETVKRHKFKGFSDDLFKAQLETFGNDNQARLFICSKGAVDLAAAIIIFYGKYAYYHHSGSVSGFKELPFSYFMQWEIIKEAKKRGLKYYNFWGIAPDDNPKHRFAGVTLFKKGFGGMKVDWLHAMDLPISKKYYLTFVFETVRRISRRL